MDLGPVAAIAEITAAALKGFSALQRLQPEYGRFWDEFERKVAPQWRDLPWTSVEQLRLDPEFVGEACGLIRGDQKKRDLLRRRFAQLSQPPPKGSRYGSDEIARRLMDAAEDAAAEAPHDDRGVVVQQRRIVEGSLTAQEKALLQELGEVEKRLGKKIDAVFEELQSDRDQRLYLATDPHHLRIEGPGGEGPSQSAAEGRLHRILDTDPRVEATVQPQGWLREETLRYRPDFIVKERDGTHWLVEVKPAHLLRSTAMRHWAFAAAEAYAEASSPGEKWRFIIVTPGDTLGAQSWHEIRERAGQRLDDWRGNDQ